LTPRRCCLHRLQLLLQLLPLLQEGAQRVCQLPAAAGCCQQALHLPAQVGIIRRHW
jgi:hypothetical protein